MRIKIVSDGTPAGTAILNADTNEPLEGVLAVSWRQDAGQLAQVTLVLIDVPVALRGDATVR